MYWARYRIPGTEVWHRVSARGYDAAVHGPDLRCGDGLCDAPVSFHKCNAGYSGTVDLASHFHSLDLAAHRSGCTMIVLKQEPPHNSVSLTDAAQDDEKRIVLNLNFDTGKEGFKSCRKPAQAESLHSPYNRFRREYVHATRSLRNLKDIFSAIAAISAKNPAALGRTHVAHCQDVRKLENFFIGADPDKFRALFNSMSAAAESKFGLSNGILTGFPRLITFEPTAKERRQALSGPGMLTGSPVFLTPRSKGSLILLNVLDLKRENLRSLLTDNGISAVVATPYINTEQTRRAAERLRLGQKAFAEIHWHIRSRQQIARMDTGFDKATIAIHSFSQPVQLALDLTPMPISA